jgi:hypothetical protein
VGLADGGAVAFEEGHGRFARLDLAVLPGESPTPQQTQWVRPTRPRSLPAPLLITLALLTLAAVHGARWVRQTRWPAWPAWPRWALLLALFPVAAVALVAGPAVPAPFPMPSLGQLAAGARAAFHFEVPRYRVPVLLMPSVDAGAASATSASALVAPAPPPPCQLARSFVALRDLIPDAVGECIDDARPDPATGDVVQRTTGGLLVAQADAVAFTDGQGTWLAGPDGLAYRPNDVRLRWEANPAGLPVVAANDPSLAAPGALLPGHRIVAFYGHPLSPGLGVLGQRPPDQMLAALERQAQQYAAADPATPVVPALHLIVAVATSGPGPDGMYRRRSTPEEIEQVAQWAERRGYLLILDVQPGHSPIDSEVAALLPFLERPYVHLALDPEWAMAPGQVPGRTFGSIGAAAVNETIRTLAGVVSRRRLPPKVLIVHRFREDMLVGSDQIRPDPRVQVVIAMDGVGPQGAKIDVYRRVVHDQPVQFAGLKIFYTQDPLPFTPRQALSLDPTPYVIIYQ